MIKLFQILKEEIELVARRSPEERVKYKNVIELKKIMQYIKNGSKGDLDLEKTNLTKLPQELKIVGGTLNLSDSKITELPQGIKVKKDLFLRGSEIAELPKNLVVGRNLHIYNTKITEIPEDLKATDLIISKNLLKQYKSIKNLRQKLPGVKGEIFSVNI